jgi:hypothetical protein
MQPRADHQSPTRIYLLLLGAAFLLLVGLGLGVLAFVQPDRAAMWAPGSGVLFGLGLALLVWFVLVAMDRARAKPAAPELPRPQEAPAPVSEPPKPQDPPKQARAKPPRRLDAIEPPKAQEPLKPTDAWQPVATPSQPVAAPSQPPKLTPSQPMSAPRDSQPDVFSLLHNPALTQEPPKPKHVGPRSADPDRAPLASALRPVVPPELVKAAEAAMAEQQAHQPQPFAQAEPTATPLAVPLLTPLASPAVTPQPRVKPAADAVVMDPAELQRALQAAAQRKASVVSSQTATAQQAMMEEGEGEDAPSSTEQIDFDSFHAFVHKHSGAEAAARLSAEHEALLPVGTEVLVRWADGNQYPGFIAQATEAAYLCRFGDGQEHWVAPDYITVR